MRSIMLASTSPRRRQFLLGLGLAFESIGAEVDERPAAGEAPAALARRLALAKAAAVASRLAPTTDTLIVAGDTVVALDDEILGKPVDAGEAAQMLRALCGRTHRVISALCLYESRSDRAHLRVVTTHVHMRCYTDDEIARYVASGDPFDKAGAYALQHPEFAPAAAVDGCAAVVVGLPLADLAGLLAECGVPVTGSLADVCERCTGLACCQRAGQGSSEK